MIDLLLDVGIAGLLVAVWWDIRRRFISKVIAPPEPPTISPPEPVEVLAPPVQPVVLLTPTKRLSITHVKTTNPDGSVTYERQ